MTIDDYMAEINKSFGQGSMRLGTDKPLPNYIPIGIFPLDLATFGGVVEGGVNMFVGKAGGGKTTQSMRVLANMQRKYEEDDDGNLGYFEDAEGTFDTKWANQLNIDLEKLLIPEIGEGEKKVDAIMSAMEYREVKLAIVDSLPMLISEKEVVKSASDDTMALTAKLITKLLKPAAVLQSRRKRMGSPFTLILINSFRNKIGGFVMGDPRVLAGGELPTYQSQLTIEFTNMEDTKSKNSTGENDAITHNRHKAKIIKFKGLKQLAVCEFDVVKSRNFDLPVGAVDDYMTTLTWGKKHGVVTGGGSSWKIFGLDQVFKNKEEMRKYLIDSPLDYLDLQARIIAIHRINFGFPALPPDNYLMRHHGEGLSLPDKILGKEQGVIEEIDETEEYVEDTEG